MRPVIALPLLLAATPALADREYCPDRPGFTTPACTVDPGRISAELGVVEWTSDRNGDEREDEILASDLFLRAGIGAATEVALGWTAFGHNRLRDAAGVMTDNGVGDVTLGIKQNLRNPDGSGAALAVYAEALLPVGGQAIGAGDWGARLLLPASADLSDTVHLAITPEIGAEPNENGHGRHLRLGSAAGLAFDLSDALNVQGEMLWLHDDAPGNRHTELQAGLFVADMLGKDWQLDAGGAVGLNRDTPDIQLSFGVSRRF